MEFRRIREIKRICQIRKEKAFRYSVLAEIFADIFLPLQAFIRRSDNDQSAKPSVYCMFGRTFMAKSQP